MCLSVAMVGAVGETMPVDFTKLRRLQERSAIEAQQNAPKIKPNSARFYVLLYVCTDPPLTWTMQEMITELLDLGVAKSTAQYAIDGLAQRGLIKKHKVNRFYTSLMPTFQGTQAIKPYLPKSGRVKA